MFNEYSLQVSRRCPLSSPLRVADLTATPRALGCLPLWFPPPVFSLGDLSRILMDTSALYGPIKMLFQCKLLFLFSRPKLVNVLSTAV